MKIGILTYHRSHNYGALLQAIALRRVLIGMGNDVYFVDYWPDYHRGMYAQFSLKTMLRTNKLSMLGYLYGCIVFADLRRKRIKNLKQFIEKHIAPHCIPYDKKTHYDVIIYGSDQIWRKQPFRPRRFNPVYFGVNDLDAKKHISYAASMGNINLNEEDKSFLQESLSRFDKLTVREENLCEVLKGLGLNSIVTIDPTLLLEQHQWMQLFPTKQNKRGKYILYYNLMRNSFDEEQIKEVAKRRNCKLLILDSDPRSRKQNHISTIDPSEFLTLIKHAEIVFSSSFHGLVFSIIFNKNVYASFLRNEGRARSLLRKLDLEDRLITPQGSMPKISDIDYTAVNEKLITLRAESLKFLKEIAR